MVLTEKGRILVAAFLADRADQYETQSGFWVPLIDAAVAIMNGDFDQRVAEGELDDPKLLERVAKWRNR